MHVPRCMLPLQPDRGQPSTYLKIPPRSVQTAVPPATTALHTSTPVCLLLYDANGACSAALAGCVCSADDSAGERDIGLAHPACLVVGKNNMLPVHGYSTR